MNRKVKIILLIFGLVIFGACAFIAAGLYAMEIEDTYGDNQDIFYKSRQGDFVVNRDAGEFGVVRKTWTRFYVTKKSDTIDIAHWWDDRQIEIYRAVENDFSDKGFTYANIEKQIKEGKLKLIKKLR